MSLIVNCLVCKLSLFCIQSIPVAYDPQYALRLCLERELDKPCVYVYAAMALFEESVELALKVSTELCMYVCM